MAYSAQNLALQAPDLAGTGGQVWIYKSADTYATVKAANYITDAINQGMRVRDLVVVMDTATPATTIGSVLALSSSGSTLSSTGVVVAE